MLPSGSETGSSSSKRRGEVDGGRDSGLEARGEGDSPGFQQVNSSSWQWKSEAPSPKWKTLSKARFWTAMGHTFPKHGASMDLGRLRARLASPLTEIKSTESGKVDVLNIEAGGKMVKMMCAPYKDPQDPLKFLEALETDMIIINANLADGADCVSPVVIAKVDR